MILGCRRAFGRRGARFAKFCNFCLCVGNTRVQRFLGQIGDFALVIGVAQTQGAWLLKLCQALVGGRAVLLFGGLLLRGEFLRFGRLVGGGLFSRGWARWIVFTQRVVTILQKRR